MPFWKWALRVHRQLCKGSLGWSRGNFKKFCSSFWSLCSGVSNAASTSGDLCGSRAGFWESECVACSWSLRNVCQMNVLAAGQQMHIWCLRMIPRNLCLGGSSHEATNQTEPRKKCLLLLLTFPIQAWENYSPCSMGLPCFPTWQKSWAHYLPPTLWGGCGVDMRNATKSLGILGLKTSAHTKYQVPVKCVFSIRDRRSEGKLGTFCRQLKTCFLLPCREESTVVKSYFEMTRSTEKKLPRKPLCPALALGSCCQQGLSKLGILRESRNSLPPQTVETFPFHCFKSCRELKIEAFWREERVLWGHFVCFGFYLPPWNAVKTWGSQHSESRPLQRNETPSRQSEGWGTLSGFWFYNHFCL